MLKHVGERHGWILSDFSIDDPPAPQRYGHFIERLNAADVYRECINLFTKNVTL